MADSDNSGKSPNPHRHRHHDRDSWKEVEDHFNSTHTSLEHRAVELRARLQQVEFREIALEEVRFQVEAWCRAKDGKKNEIEAIGEWRKELQAIRGSIEGTLTAVAEAEARFKELVERVRREVEERGKDIGTKKDELIYMIRDNESKEKAARRLLKLDQRLVAKRVSEVELKEKEIQEKEKRVVNVLNAVMDGKALRRFMCDRYGNIGLIRNVVMNALSFSSDPAKLVLDAMQGFYPRKGDEEFKEGVIRSSCIFLLEKLREMGPEIRPNVREQAMKVACDWRSKMSAEAGHSLEVFGFLQLLGSYGLASDFDANELLNLFEIVSEYEQAPKLFHILGLADKLPDFIESLIERTQRIKAIKYIFLFNMIDKFPPLSLLHEHLMKTGRLSGEDENAKEQIKAISNELAGLRAVAKCISNCNPPQSEYSRKILEERIMQLEIERAAAVKRAHPLQQFKARTCWTRCSTCGTLYQCYKEDKRKNCQNCSIRFIGFGPELSNQNEIPTARVASKVVSWGKSGLDQLLSRIASPDLSQSCKSQETEVQDPLEDGWVYMPAEAGD